ncbi:MAG: tail fiber domain-containing protein [Saprospiraceae bacterium]|nr:tail fiber domain-containing protein [Saprospiraceae bacterium]
MTQRLCFALLLALCAVAPVLAQSVPEGFNYQSAVRNANGDPLVNQTVTLLFTIRSGAPNGPVAYTEKQTATTNQFGLVNLIVGQGTVLQGTFSTINWGGGAKYLNVSIETSPNVFDELGSSQLMSVPFALYSKFAANGGTGGTGDDWGTQTVVTNPTIAGNGTGGNPIGLAQQSAQTGQVLKWNGATWTPSDDLVSNGTNGGTVTQINTGAGLSGGPITTAGTISLSNTGVAPNVYGSATQIPVLTIDAQGRITNVVFATPQPGTVGITGSTGLTVAQNGTNFTLTNTGDTNASDDLTTSSTADGDISGAFSNLQIKANAVGSTELAGSAVTTGKIAAGAVTAVKLDNMGASNGQILKWNGTTWAPSTDLSGSVLTAGNGINITGTAPNQTIENTGDTDAGDDLTITSTAGGDVTGLFANLQLKADVVSTTELADNAVENANIKNATITGTKLAAMSATSGQVLKFNGTTWTPANDQTGTANVLEGAGINVTVNGTDFTVTNTGDLNDLDDITTSTIANGDVTGPFSNLQLKAAVVTNTELAANAVGTNNLINGAVTAVKINNMGAGTGQILRFNGTNWAPSNEAAGAADNWGTQVVVSTATLSGSGTSVSPLTLAQQGASAGQVLKWNGSTWIPSNDNSSGTGDNYSSGTGINISGTAPNFTINNTGDLSNTNELQTISLSGTQLTLSNGGGTVTLPSGGGGGNNYAAGTGISITGSAPNFTINNTGDGDSNPTNELQTLTLNGTNLSISNGNTVNLNGLGGGGGGFWAGNGNEISNTNTGNVLVGSAIGSFGKLQVLAGTETAITASAANAAPAIYSENTGTGAGGFFNATGGGPALITGKGNVGIGLDVPTFRLDVNGDARLLGIGAAPALKLEGNSNDFVRMNMSNSLTGSWTVLSKGGGNTGEFAIDFAKTQLQTLRVFSAKGDQSVQIGSPSGNSTKTTLYHGDKGITFFNNNNSHSWEFWVTNNNGSLALYNDQQAGVNPVGIFALNGLYTPSDQRLKKDIIELAGGVLNKIMHLEAKQYRYNSEASDAKASIGFLAQDVKQYFPELVGEMPARDGSTSYLNLNYSGFGVIAIKAIQEQQTQIDALKKENEALKARLDRLERKMNDK